MPILVRARRTDWTCVSASRRTRAHASVEAEGRGESGGVAARACCAPSDRARAYFDSKLRAFAILLVRLCFTADAGAWLVRLLFGGATPVRSGPACSHSTSVRSIALSVDLVGDALARRQVSPADSRFALESPRSGATEACPWTSRAGLHVVGTSHSEEQGGRCIPCQLPALDKGAWSAHKEDFPEPCRETHVYTWA